MTITEIKKQKKGSRYSIFLDGEYAFSLQDEIIVKNKLKLGDELGSKRVEELKLQDGDLTAFDKALSILEKTMKTEKGVRDYLKEKEYLKPTIDNVVEKLKEYGYLDDGVYVENYIRTYTHSKGKKKIKYELLTKGIKESIINEKLENIDDENEIENCKALAKKYLKNKELDLKTKQKLYTHLSTKGYDFSVIKSVSENIFKGEEDEGWN